MRYYREECKQSLITCYVHSAYIKYHKVGIMVFLYYGNETYLGFAKEDDNRMLCMKQNKTQMYTIKKKE